jgi:tetratricopeptide (TPR) repeat protein
MNEILHRLHELENQINDIRAQLDPQGKPRRKRKALKFVVTNWGFFGFVITVVVAGLVYWHYDISYFENQKNISIVKKSADFYAQLGDRMLLLGEPEAAAESYRTALQINPSNVAASRGLFKSLIFEPLKGQEYSNNEVVDQRINYLKTLLTDDKERYIIDYLEAERFVEQEDFKLAKQKYQESITKNPEFVYGYLALAYVSVLDGDGVDFGKNQLDRAIQLNENSPLALNSLGFYYIVKLQFDKAISHLERAQKLMPYLEILIHLGNAHRYKGGADNLDEALLHHKRALDLLKTSNEKESLVAGEYAINYMPESEGDNETPKEFATFVRPEEKEMLVFYELSFDYAMKHDWVNADKSFNQAWRLDEDRAFQSFVENKIQSLERFTENKPDRETLLWFEKKRHRLSSEVQ